MNNVCTNNPCATPPSVVTVQTIDGIKSLNNCFVYVVANNTTYFVSPSHEITIIFSGPVFVDGYDAAANSLGLRSQVCYDFKANYEIIYAPDGSYRLAPLKEVQ